MIFESGCCGLDVDDSRRCAFANVLVSDSSTDPSIEFHRMLRRLCAESGIVLDPSKVDGILTVRVPLFPVGKRSPARVEPDE